MLRDEFWINGVFIMCSASIMCLASATLMIEPQPIFWIVSIPFFIFFTIGFVVWIIGIKDLVREL